MEMYKYLQKLPKLTDFLSHESTSPAQYILETTTCSEYIFMVRFPTATKKVEELAQW